MKKTTSELLHVLQLRFDGRSVLDVGSPEGEMAAWAVMKGYSGSYYHTDLVACRNIHIDEVTVYFSADLPRHTFDMVTMDCTVMDTPLAADLALHVAQILSPSGEFLSIPPHQWSADKWIHHLKQAYSEVFTVSEFGATTVVSCTKPNGLWNPPHRMVRAEIGDSVYMLRSAPGVFSPDAVDQGTLAMLEEMEKHGPQHHVLDLGCGIGIVSVHLAAVWGCNVVAVDTNARALQLTTINAEQNGIAHQVRVIPSDGFSDIDVHDLDAVASNPPYHSDYSVAKRFISGAHQRLRVGGRLWVVVKRPDWYINRIRSVFGGCTVIQKNGYFVLTVAKKAPEETTRDKPKSTSRKHLKKMQDAEKRKKSRIPQKW
ncbi:MAG: methyltransferase [Alicyclobacillus sp.]|nr:methyltransferase [Alicyclobacillus sp.]